MIRLRDESLAEDVLAYAFKITLAVGFAAAMWIGVVYP